MMIPSELPAAASTQLPVRVAAVITNLQADLTTFCSQNVAVGRTGSPASGKWLTQRLQIITKYIAQSFLALGLGKYALGGPKFDTNPDLEAARDWILGASIHPRAIERHFNSEAMASVAPATGRNVTFHIAVLVEFGLRELKDRCVLGAGTVDIATASAWAAESLQVLKVGLLRC